MQTVSATLATALTSRERQIAVRVKVDWNRDGTYSFDPGVARDIAADTLEGIGDIGDLSSFVGSVSVDRSLSTDLPEASKITAGFGAAQATIEVAGNLSSGMSLSQALGGTGGGAFAWRRLSAPCYVELGAVGAVGPEYVRVFTGRIRSLGVAAGSSAVSISALDGRERLRTPVKLPVVIEQTGNYYITQIASANGITPVAETSLSPGIATPPTDTSDPWELLQQIADAEQGVVLFDENDTLRFYNRDHMSGGAAVATLTTDPVTFANLKAVSASESIDSVRNYVTVGAVPLRLDDVNTEIWRIGETLAVGAYALLTVPVEFELPFYSIASLNYAACTTVDGLGTNITNLTLSYTGLTTSSGTVNIYNPNNFTVFLVYTTAVPGTGVGEPSLNIGGQLLRPPVSGAYSSIRTDPTSVAAYGTQPLDASANVWRQSKASADSLAAFLLAALKDPHPTLSGVEIVGDPRLQLTDRVRVVEADGLALDGEFWLVGITTTFAAGDGLAQSVTLREV